MKNIILYYALYFNSFFFHSDFYAVKQDIKKTLISTDRKIERAKEKKITKITK